MKILTSHFFSKSLVFSVLLVFLFALNACYTPTYSASDRMAPRVSARDEVVRKYVRADLKVGQRYTDFGFGNERIIKPQSFRRLDSLYTEFSNEEQKSGSSRNRLMLLKNEIEAEKSKVMQDTVHFLYEKPHFFAQQSGDSASVIFADFTLNTKNEVIRANIHYLFDTPSRNLQLYRVYLARESFVDFGYLPSTEESQFYTFFDGMLQTLLDAESKGRFIEHTLQIMRAANQQKGMSTEPLIKQHVINNITHNVKGYKALKWSRVYTNLDENDVLLSYELDHEWTYSDPFGMQHEMRRMFVLNPFFEIVEVSEINLIRN
jgi:hypothetical protein